jgi:hypothetical protein
MAHKKQTRTDKDQASSERRQQPAPKSLAIAERGINTAQQFASLMSALMTDLLNGSVTPGIGNATCNAGGKLLKMVELNQKYGQAQVDTGLKNMQLVTDGQ